MPEVTQRMGCRELLNVHFHRSEFLPAETVRCQLSHSHPSPGIAQASVILHGTSWEFKREPEIVPSVGSLLPPVKRAPTSHGISTSNRMTRKSNELQMEGGGGLQQLPPKKGERKSFRKMENLVLLRALLSNPEGQPQSIPSSARRSGVGSELIPVQRCAGSLAGWVFRHRGL